MKPTLFIFWMRLPFFLLLMASTVCSEIHGLTLKLQQRDPETGQIKIETEEINPLKVGVIAVDVWNYHWCKTATMRVDAIVPRMNKALEAV